MPTLDQRVASLEREVESLQLRMIASFRAEATSMAEAMKRSVDAAIGASVAAALQPHLTTLQTAAALTARYHEVVDALNKANIEIGVARRFEQQSQADIQVRNEYGKARLAVFGSIVVALAGLLGAVIGSWLK